MSRLIVMSVVLMLLCGNSLSAQRASSGGRSQGARHTGSRVGGGHAGGHRGAGPKYGPYHGRYSDSVEIYNFGFPVGPHRPRFRSRASYHIVPMDPVTAKTPRTLIPVNRYAVEYQLYGERLFRDGQYDDALRAVQHAIIEDPANGKLFLFQAQVLLAKGDYATASNLLRYATDSLELRDWGYVIENRGSFYKPAAFAEQIHKLATLVEKSPDDGPAQFLLGYQYLYSGQGEEAGVHLSRAIDLNTHRDLAERLLPLTTRGTTSVPTESIPVPPPPPSER